MKKLVLSLLILISISSGCSTEPESTDSAINEDELKQIIQKAIDKYDVPGVQVCVLDKSGSKAVEASSGYSNTNTKVVLSNSTKIKAGSITKSFTGIGILKLVEKGLISLDDSLGKYVALNNHEHDGVTIKRLLNMHSGIKGYINDDASYFIIDDMMANHSKHYNPEELVNYGFQLTKNQGATGENEYHYSNTNYILLGMIIESVTGQSYAEYIRQKITEPLGLSSTYIPTDNNYIENVSGGWVIDKEDNTVDDCSTIDLSYVWSAGAVITTASDLCKWMNAIGNEKVVSGSTLDYVYEGLETMGGIYTCGLINDQTKLWHNGTVLGYHGEMCFLKNSGISIAVLTNCNVVGVDGDPVVDIMESIISTVNK